MIDICLKIIKSKLDYYMTNGGKPGDNIGRAAFISGEKMGGLPFIDNNINILLINIEEEAWLRDSNPYVRLTPTGKTERVHPDVKVVLTVMLVANAKRYDDALKYISQAIQFFQSNSCIAWEDADFAKDGFTAKEVETAKGMGPFMVEMATLPLAQQKDVWSAFNSAFLPSVMYRVKYIVFQDQNPTVAEHVVTDIDIEVVDAVPAFV